MTKQTLTVPEQMLYTRIDEILFYQWDPIGISTSNWVRHEYHAYLADVFTYALQQDSPDFIATYLGQVTTERMGLPNNEEKNTQIAQLIMDIKQGLAL